MTGVVAVLVVALAAVNPPRLHARVDAAGRLRAAAVAAVAALTATSVVAVMTVLSGPLMDWLELSAPTVRLAAGLVAAVAGAVHLAAPAPTVASRAGLGAGVVPLAFPLLLRPEVLLVALSLAIDHGAGVATGVAAVALASGAVSAVADHTSDRAPLWAAGGRVVGGVLVLVGVGMVVDGALSV